MPRRDQFVEGLDVGDDLRLNQIGQVARQPPRRTVRIEAVGFVCIVDAERADDRIVGGGSRIGVKSE